MLYSYFDGDLSGRIILSPDESHHLVAVRRAEAGETFTALDGRGGAGLCRLVLADRKRAEAEVVSVNHFSRPTAPLWLAQAIPLGGAMENIIQKATELGAARVTPLVTDRSEMRIGGERLVKKLEKWRQVAIEAVKQCGNPFIPEIDMPSTIDALPKLPVPRARAVCSLERDAQSFTKYLNSTDVNDGMMIVVGPEGDFTDAEYLRLREDGFAPVTLGPLVLRSDTAAIAALAVASGVTQNGVNNPLSTVLLSKSMIEDVG
jgi:16S rRNA (uracil1498-N3)-methyltransferase